MTKKQALEALADHEQLSQQVFGEPTDWRIEQRGKEWVLVAPVRESKGENEQSPGLVDQTKRP